LKTKAVLFDLGNTLVYQEPYEAFQKILRVNGMDKSLREIREAFESGNREFDVERNGVPSSREFYTRWNMLILKHLGIARSRVKLAREIDRQWFDFSKSHLYPETRETLERLKKMGLKIGLVTGGYQVDLKQILPEVGLQQFFDVQVCADTVGKRKPHPLAFQYALEKLNVRAAEAIFIGDDYRSDYLGAQDVGMIPVLICREGSAVSGVRVIHRLDEIFEIIRKIDS
jgi:putative hydrolase of the HAD superfamily